MKQLWEDVCTEQKRSKTSPVKSIREEPDWQQIHFYNVGKSCCFSVFGFRVVLTVLTRSLGGLFSDFHTCLPYTPQRWWRTAKMAGGYIHLFIRSINKNQIWFENLTCLNRLLCYLPSLFPAADPAKPKAGPFLYPTSPPSLFSPLLQSHKYGRIKVKIFSISSHIEDENVTHSLWAFKKKT